VKGLEQISLFTTDVEKKTNYLHIVRDGKVMDIPFSQLFDASKYNSMRAISFVASPKFFFEMTKDFEDVQLIIGIEDGNVAGSFATGLEELLAIEKRIQTFESFSEDIQSKLLQDRYQIRYSKKNDPIHSKIYLLEGVNETRVMIGSANFTQTAFSERKQYEELLVFDNSPLFNLYSERYQSIYEETVDYIPEKIRNTLITEPINYIDPDYLYDVLIDEIQKGSIVTEFTESQIEEIKIAEQQYQKEQVEISKLNQVIEIITKKDRKTGNYIIQPINQIDKKKVTLKSTLSRINSKTEEVDSRIFLEYYDSNHLLFKKTEEATLVNFSQESNVHEIKKQLQLIHSFIEAYKIFTVQSDPKTQTRIFEAILYSFISAHVWKMREHYVLDEGRDSVRRNIPLFLVLAGRTSSGKTSALEFISLLLGNINPYMSYEQISKKNMILDLFYTSNVSPILVDEVDSKFFTSTAADKGERLIKDVTNNLEGKHPVFICTTNTTHFDATAQTISRIYYLQIDNTFDKNKQAASSKYLGDIMGQINSSLYQDFTYRLGDLIRHDETFYSPEDFLSIARQIFIEYHEQCNLPLPNWFPKERFDDYIVRGKNIWRELYISNPQAFDLRTDNTIFVRIEELGKRTKREREEIINYLPPESILEDNTVLILNKKIFLNFIDRKEKRSLFKKLFN